MWGVRCAPSTSTFAPTACAASAIFATGLIVPSTLPIPATQTIFVRSVITRSSESMSISPPSVIGSATIFAPVCMVWICHGMRFEWCSISEMTISSPSCRFARPHAYATRLMASVHDLVKTISREPPGALRNSATFVRAPSYAAVDSAASSYTARWMFALWCS